MSSIPTLLTIRRRSIAQIAMVEQGHPTETKKRKEDMTRAGERFPMSKGEGLQVLCLADSPLAYFG